MKPLLSRLDRWLFRRPFEDGSARRYARRQRSGFRDLDARLITRWDRELRAARTVVDVGAGPGVFAARLAGAHPHLAIIAVEPSAGFAPQACALTVRARGEALPLADRSIDVAVCVSSIRHVADRAACLRELRRVVKPTGIAYIVELDPSASRQRIHRHRQHMRAGLARLAFGPLVVKTAPSARTIASLARDAGWQRVTTHPDDEQPVYVMSLQ